ncbi:hypothetical protein JMJ35_010097 [Cladonia borealis]|uniref:Translocation protein SEC62 n=1 Tax=Cladonia borealis TaxID=184061 RepID=A0AA39QTE5_9LECA|nr:hypothetical protein JMJ35_010097 [Cladonia borealis]
MAAVPPQGGQPTPQQMAAMQQQLAMEAAKRGMTPQQFQAMQRQELEAQARKEGLTFQQYIEKLRSQALENHKRQVEMQQQQAAQQTQQAQGQPQVQGQQGQQVPIAPGAPDPKAQALAKWLRSQDLKTRTCILNGQRKDMFRVKRALRAIESPAYTTACKKNPLLPPLTPAMPKTEIFKLLPLSLLALRVSKIDPHAGHNHAPSKPQKRVKGLWTVKIEQQQDISDDLHYVWLYEGPQWRMKLYAVGALILIMTVVMFPLWPVTLRIGVWYLSMGFLGLIGLFFAMAIFRLMLFCVTVFTVPPGLWLYPNLFEDVGFFDSFRPVWGWQEEKKKKSKKSKKGETGEESKGSDAASTTTATVTASSNGSSEISRRHAHAAPRVEEVEDE